MIRITQDFNMNKTQNTPSTTVSSHFKKTTLLESWNLCSKHLSEQIQIRVNESGVGYEWDIRIHSTKSTPQTLEHCEDLYERDRHPEVLHWLPLINDAWHPGTHGGHCLGASVQKDC